MIGTGSFQVAKLTLKSPGCRDKKRVVAILGDFSTIKHYNLLPVSGNEREWAAAAAASGGF